MARPALRRFIFVSVITASLCALAAVLLAVTYSDSLVRWSMMRRLCSEDAGERQRGLRYLVKQIAGGDPQRPIEPDDPQRVATLDYARRMLVEADDECFETIVAGLSAAGAWGADMGEPWVRYLAKRAREVGDEQQSAIAVELGKLAWRRAEHHDDSRVALTIEYLLKDDSADVRLNALSAAAALPAEARLSRLRYAAGDAEPVIRERAEGMLELLGLGGFEDNARPGEPPGPGADAIPEARRLAELEAMATGSADLPISDDLPYLIRLQSVRVSRSAEPADLLPLFEAEQPTLRDIAAVVARERFSDAELRGLATEMLNSFDDRLRMSGAIVAGMAQRDAKLSELLRLRAANATDWIVQQHLYLGLAMQDATTLPPEGQGFDPVALLSHERMPRTTVVLAMLEMGRLEGMDWLLSPFGEPPASLPPLLDQFRWWLVIERYFPKAPEFWMWAERDVQRKQVEMLRDWYLLYRQALRFDASQKFSPQRHRDAEKDKT